MDVRLINPFVAAVEQVFEVMLGLELTPGQCTASRTLELDEDSVSAAILLRGGASGASVLRLSHDFALAFVQKIDESARDIADGLDAIGEFANMVAGIAKQNLTDHLVEISTPSIHVGADPPNLARLSPWLRVPFEAPFGSFELAVSIQVRRPLAAVATAASSDA